MKRERGRRSAQLSLHRCKNRDQHQELDCHDDREPSACRDDEPSFEVFPAWIQEAEGSSLYMRCDKCA